MEERVCEIPIRSEYEHAFSVDVKASDTHEAPDNLGSDLAVLFKILPNACSIIVFLAEHTNWLVEKNRVFFPRFNRTAVHSDGLRAWSELKGRTGYRSPPNGYSSFRKEAVHFMGILKLPAAEEKGKYAYLLAHEADGKWQDIKTCEILKGCMGEKKGFIVHATYRVEDSKAKVYLFGRLDCGESFCVINDYRPYFYIRESDEAKAKKLLKVEFVKTKRKNFDREPVVMLTFDNPKDTPQMRRLLQENGISCYEADIRFAYRYMIDHDIKSVVAISGEAEKPPAGLFVDRVFRNAKVRPSSFDQELKILSIDIETAGDASQVYSIALVMGEKKEVLITKNVKQKHAVPCASEEELLTRLLDNIRAWDPDIILGWNVIDFDLKVLRERLKKYGKELTICRDDTPCALSLSTSYFMDSTAKCPGRMVLDGISLLKASFIRLDDYKLNTAAKEFLGEEKEITSNDRRAEIERLFRADPGSLVSYNLKDAELALGVVQKSRALELAQKRSVITGMELDRVKASIASLDSLYLRELKEKGFVAPSGEHLDREERIRGGFVRDSVPGVYDNIIVCDFKSLYPSLMRTFNIDPWSFVPKKHLKEYKKKELIEAPNGAHFLNADGIMPMILESLFRQRELAKKNKDDLASYALKITMNSFFGVLASPQCRFYSLEMANAITHFGQFFIKLSAERIEEKGFKVIYGDTDSLFISTNDGDYEKTLVLGKKIAKEMNEFFREYIKEKYGRESVLELEFEKVYKKFLMPRIRGSEKGAKKRYAGIIVKDGKEVMDFVGLEFVRSDWTELAKRFQLELLESVFRGQDPIPWVRKFIMDLRIGKFDDLLVYKKAIRKGVEKYTKTTPPHIKAARKIGRSDMGIISYVMTSDGPEPVEAVKHPLDYEHYIEKQLRPVAEAILQFSSVRFDDALTAQKQSKLSGF